MTDQNKKPPISIETSLRAVEEIYQRITLQTAIVMMIALACDREIKRLR